MIRIKNFYYKYLLGYERLLYLIGLGGLIFFLALLPYATSVAMFWLASHWFLTGNFRLKFRRLAQNRLALIFLAIYVIHFIGMFYSTDIDYALFDLKRKLPLFVIPFIFATNESPTSGERKVLLHVFMAGILLSSFYSFFLYNGFMGFSFNNTRELSPIISHIRLALCIVLSIAILFNYLYTKRSKRQKLLYFLLLSWFVFFLFLLESFTGFLLGGLVLFLFSARVVRHTAVTWIKYLFAGAASIIVLFFVWQLVVAIKFNLPKEYSSEESITHSNQVNGIRYIHEHDNPQRENGYPVWQYIDPEGFEEAWAQRSNQQLRNEAGHATSYYYVLLRYLTSKGLKKDSTSITQLTSKDIQNIENGIPNYRFPEINPVQKRFYKVIWEIQSFSKGGDPTNQSISQRMVFLSTGFKIFKDNWLIGVGTGDVWKEFKARYEQSPVFSEIHPWMRAHNQYLTFFITFGIIGGICVLFALFYPVIKISSGLTFPATMFVLIAFLSMLAEDTIETQAGVIFFSYFYTLFVLMRRENK